MSNLSPAPGPDAVSTEHRYPPRALVRDYLLAAAGLAVALSPFIFARPGQTATVVLGVFGGLAGFLALRTARRQVARFTLSATDFRRGGQCLTWGDIAGVRLRHFTTRQGEPGSGWMDLRLAGSGTRITVDSELDGFLAVAQAAHGAARAKGLTFDPTTEANFHALGLDAPSAPPP
jgi:hypothetical protein